MSIFGKDRRQFFRHPVSVPIKLRVAAHQQEFDISSSNISLGGLNFTWPKKLSKGTMIDIEIPVKKKFFDVKAKVVYSKEDKKTARFHTGVCFSVFPSAFKARLAEEVLEILEFQKSLSRQFGHKVTEEAAAQRWISEFANQFP